MASNAGLAAAVDKVVLNYTADAISDPTGVSWLKCALTGKTLDVFIQVSSITQMMAATWKFGEKLNALVAGGSPAPVAVAPVAAPVATPQPSATPIPKAAQPAAAAPAPAASSTSAAASAGPRLIPTVKGTKITPSSGKATYLYMTLTKAQAAFKAVEPQLASAFGKSIAVEIDWKFVDLVEFYGYIVR